MVKNDIYKQKARQAPAESVVAWWQRLQQLGNSVLGDPCTWMEDQQEVTIASLTGPVPKDLARVVNKEQLFSEDYGVRLGHLEDLTRECGESRPMQELTHNLTLHLSDPA